jgi:pre-rRNA-processing protein IPI3
MASTNGVPPHGASSSSAAAAASSSTSSAVSRFLDEVLLASSTSEGPVHAWDLKTGMQLRVYKHTACGRGGLTLVGDDYLVAAHVAKCALDVWTLDRESSTHRFFVGEAIGVVAASPCGALFAAGGVDGGVFLWETSTGRLLRSWPAHFKAVSAIAFACDGGVLVTGGEDTVVTTWSVSAALDPARGADEAPASTHSWAEHALPVTGLAIARGAGSGAASLVVSCSADRTCRVWTLGGGHLLRTMRLPCALTSVAIDRCEATVYAGGADGRIFEIPLHASAAIAESLGADDASGGGAAAVLEGHGRAVTSLGAFSSHSSPYDRVGVVNAVP